MGVSGWNASDVCAAGAFSFFWGERGGGCCGFGAELWEVGALLFIMFVYYVLFCFSLLKKMEKKIKGAIGKLFRTVSMRCVATGSIGLTSLLRNSTSLFSLSSGTIGGAMEASLFHKKSIALSFAFESREHDRDVITAACRRSLQIIEVCIPFTLHCSFTVATAHRRLRVSSNTPFDYPQEI